MRYLRGYLALVGTGLFLQGASSLVLHEGVGATLASWHGLLTPDDRHAGLHVVWGLLLLAAVAVGGEPLLVAAGYVFGVFYLALGVLGILVHHPFGLMLGAGENGFHLIVGPLALILAVLHTRAVRRPAPVGGGLGA